MPLALVVIQLAFAVPMELPPLTKYPGFSGIVTTVNGVVPGPFTEKCESARLMPNGVREPLTPC